MKKFMKRTWAVLIVISLVLALASCGGGNDPKSLAKQSYDAMVELEKVGSSGAREGDPKYDAVMKKFSELTEKVQQLSSEDKEIYNTELTRLITAGS